MSDVGDALSLLLYPFAASVAFVLIHAYLGVHVLRRNIVFADLALAQLSALGATVAFALGYAPASPAGFGYALAFTALGAALLTATRALGRLVSQEAFVGILYVVATAATVLVVDRSPQGAEHVKRILIGSILTVEPDELVKFVALYAAIGLFHWFARAPMLAVANEAQPAGRSRRMVSLWDFLFFLSFGIVVTIFTGAAPRRRNWRVAADGAAMLALAAVLASSLWLIFNPAADQPLLALLERASGTGPAIFLSASDRAIYDGALRDAVRFQAEVAALNARERAARVAGAPLADDEVRRIASYQQSFNEMARGERFVEEVLRAKARARERWIVGLPAAALALTGLVLLVRALRRRRR